MGIKFAPVPPTRSTTTRSEIIRDVEFYYPHLTGPLKRMFLAFVNQPYNDEPPIEKPDLPELPNACPHCGSTFEVDE
jgi:hypothetical protein